MYECMAPTAPDIPLILRPEVYQEAEKHVAALRDAGYEMVAEINGYRTGMRVNTRSRTYYEARVEGIGAVIAVGHAPNSVWSRNWKAADIEMLVLRWDGETISLFAPHHVEGCIEDVLASI